MESEALTAWVDATPSKLTVLPLPSPPIFMPNALPATTLPIFPGLVQAPSYAGLHTRWIGYSVAWHCDISVVSKF